MKAIYMILNLKNGKRYIGSAKTYRTRKNSHFSMLERSIHHNIHLQRSYNKHGKDFFSMSVLEKIDDAENLVIREQFWMDSCSPEYNINPNASNWLGRKHSESSKIKMSISAKKRRATKKTKEKMSKIRTGSVHTSASKEKMSLNRVNLISQFSISGEFIKTWQNPAMAAKFYSLNYRDLQRMAVQEIKKSKKCGGYIWRYKK